MAGGYQNQGVSEMKTIKLYKGIPEWTGSEWRVRMLE